MTEEEWLESTHPHPMLVHLSGSTKDEYERTASPLPDRKSRLFAVGCLRQWLRQQIYVPGVPDLLDAAEKHADGLLSYEALQRFRLPYRADWRPGVGNDLGSLLEEIPGDSAWTVATAPLCIPKEQMAALIRCVFGNPFQRVRLCAGDHTPYNSDECRCLVFRWRQWYNGTVPAIARAIYDNRAFERMPLLADALEDAGCSDLAILNHCRGLERCPICQGAGMFSQDHPWGDTYATEWLGCHCETGWVPMNPALYTRGDWVLDLLLGRS